jgi:thiamine biosynthesis lipoprotein
MWSWPEFGTMRESIGTCRTRSTMISWMPWAAACLWGMATLFGLAGEPALRRFEFSQAHMGTLFRIIVYAPDAATASRASNAAFQRIATLDNTMTDYSPSSELMSLCRKAGGPPVRVSEDLYRVLAQAQELAARTNGAFDVTVGPVMRLWRRARRQREMPDAEDLARARKLVGYQKLRLDPRAQTAQLLEKGMRLDLGGIAKGYAADEALAVLKQHGITRALVVAGGEMAASAPPPGRDGWRIGIAPLESPEKPPMRFLMLREAAVSTSGDAEQYVELNGTRYSHIVDPRTGMGVVGRSSVTVVAPKATASDSLATAVSVLGPEQGLELIRSTPGAAVLIIRATDRGSRIFELNLSPYAVSAKDQSPP